MRSIGWLAALALATAPLLVDAAPASAATANQYRAQGRGVYLNSKGHPRGGYRPYRYGYPPPPPYGYGYQPYGYGYPPPGYGYSPYGYAPY